MDVLPGIFRLELPMPFELRHVNVYLLRDGEHVTLIDTGLQTDESRQALNEKLAALKVPVERINRILVTHIHPDHFGLAGELRERAGAELVEQERRSAGRSRVRKDRIDGGPRVRVRR